MTFRTLIRRNLRFHWRAHLGVVLGAAVGSAALIGALVVGDSVRGSLRERATLRLGNIGYALEAGDRSFTDTLAGKMPRDLIETWVDRGGFHAGPAAALVVSGIASRQDGKARASNVRLTGLAKDVETESEEDRRLFHHPDSYQLWNYAKWFNAPAIQTGEVWLNEQLAAQLAANVGDEIIFRIQKPAVLSRDAPLAPKSENHIGLRLRVGRIVPPERLGDFSLRSAPAPVLNAFLNIADLQNATGLPGRANTIVCGGAIGDSESQPEPRLGVLAWNLGSKLSRMGLSTLGHAIQSRVHLRKGLRLDPALAAWDFRNTLADVASLSDYEVALRLTSDNRAVELTSRRVFLDPALVSVAERAATNRVILFRDTDIPCNDSESVLENGRPILTYLASLLRAGSNATPYSMVAAAGPPWTPAELRDDEIVVSQWLADDLHLKPGDEIALGYFLPESGAKLTEATNAFRIHSIVPMELPWADRTLMPEFPGIEKAESTRDWDAGFPLTYKIRPKDEEYWKKYRGTPKAFITLAAGQKMWGNRFGNLTAIRFPIPTNSVGDEVTSLKSSSANAGETNKSESPYVVSYMGALEKKILASLKPEELGLRFEPVHERALKAAEESQDFGGLFLGFSFFLIIAALLLMAMLFQFGLEQRAPEIGTFLALGFTPKQVRRLLLREGVMLAFLGGLLGVVGGIYFAKALLHGLTTVWRDAVGATTLSFHISVQTLLIGLLASVAISAVTVRLALRKFVKQSARELLIGEVEGSESKVQSRKSKVIAGAALVAGLVLIGWAVARAQTANAEVFFGAGALLLVAGLSFANVWLAALVRNGAFPLAPFIEERENRRQASDEPDAVAIPFTLSHLAVRGCARRRKRSLATVAMLACGSFLIVSIGVFRLDANRDTTKMTSGTGGFALIGETTMPVVKDLNSRSGREFFALIEADLNDVNFVPFRVHEGDEASCLNLNAAQKPRLLGVKSELLEGRFGFAKGAGWPSLQLAIGNRPSAIEIPAIGDANSIQWAMHKKVGDTLDYVDERGQPFKVRIVGAVANSILQGSLVIDEKVFVNRFPSESGYRMFLIDTPSNHVAQVSATLSRALQDVGLELTPASRRLAQFNAVQNTYLGTFQVLGGLGLLLGSVGLGIVVLRNVLERRGELALLVAVGFRRQQVQRLLLIENGALLLTGLSAGVIAAAVAVLPALLSPAAQLPYGSLAMTLGGVLVNGALWTWVATRLAVRRDLLTALRNE